MNGQGPHFQDCISFIGFEFCDRVNLSLQYAFFIPQPFQMESPFSFPTMLYIPSYFTKKALQVAY